MKDKFILNDETIIELETGASLSALQVLSPNKAAMLTTWEKLTPYNLSSVQMQNGEDLTVGRYTDLILVSETSVIQDDGGILTTYCLREKTAIEKRLDALEQGQEVQDGAIGDIAAATSTIAEQMEGGKA